MVGVKGTAEGVLRLLEPRNGGRLLVPFNLQRSSGRNYLNRALLCAALNSWRRVSLPSGSDCVQQMGSTGRVLRLEERAWGVYPPLPASLLSGRAVVTPVAVVLKMCSWTSNITWKLYKCKFWGPTSRPAKSKLWGG